MILPSSPVRKILICDDDESFQLALRYQLKKSNFDVHSAKNSCEVLAIIKNQKMDLLLLDVQMRTSTEGLDSITKIKAIDDDLPIVMLSGLKDFQTLKTAMNLGASDYLVKDSAPDEILLCLNRVFEKKALLVRQSQASFEVKQDQSKRPLVGSSPAMQSLKKMIEKVKASPQANVLIHGETGTGKEVVARFLRHANETGTLVPFLAVDSATIHSQTAESILFGHEKGAFTGADKAKKGIFEEANGGIVYFDEIANMSLEIQAKLLRVLQEKEVTRLGGARSVPLQFRVIAASNQDLEALVKKGLFKEDLLQRLNVIPIHIPPLRERREDISDLIEHSIDLNGGKIHLTEAALAAMQEYDWPGNVRELSNVIAYLTTLADEPEVDVTELHPKIKNAKRAAVSSESFSSADANATFYDQVSAFEKALLLREFEESKGKVSRMAEKLGVDRSHLYTKLKQYGIYSGISSASIATKQNDPFPLDRGL